jgi:EF-P beta-lysylation protein EpmB
MPGDGWLRYAARMSREDLQAAPARTLTVAERDAWRRQLRDGFSTANELLDHLGLDGRELDTGDFRAFPLRVTRAFANRMEPGNPADPLLRQVLPMTREQESPPAYSADPVGEQSKAVAPGMLHKYQGRVLLVATGACAIHCRYCFRREFPYADHQQTRSRWPAALAYISERPDVHEVILSGGDPWVLDTGRLRELTDRLRGIPHLRRLRVHTRMPVVLPDRVDDALLRWLGSLPWPVTVVVHANHAREFDGPVAASLARLHAAGTRVLNQAVLLRGINDSEEALADLMETGFEAGALPYYLHLLDRVRGSAHFEVPEGRARELLEALRRRLPGYLVPRLVRETPDAPFKLPLL